MINATIVLTGIVVIIGALAYLLMSGTQSALFVGVGVLLIVWGSVRQSNELTQEVDR